MSFNTVWFHENYSSYTVMKINLLIMTNNKANLNNANQSKASFPEN